MRRWILLCAALTVALATNTSASDARNSHSVHRGVHAKQLIAASTPHHRSQPVNENEAPFVNGHYVLTGDFPVNGYHKDAPVVVIVDKSSHFTYALQLQDHKIVRILTISNAVGSADRPTPTGPYFVTQKKMYPVWVPPTSIDPKQKRVPPYNQTHKNPLGVAAIDLSKFDIELHGTNYPGAIRKSVSHGCIRHSNPDILKLYAIVNRGDRVYIVNKFRGKVLNQSDFISKKRTH